MVEVGISLEAEAALLEVEAAAVARGAAHSQAPSTTRQPIDSVGAGPSEALEEVADGPNCARPTAARMIAVRTNFIVEDEYQMRIDRDTNDQVNQSCRTLKSAGRRMSCTKF